MIETNLYPKCCYGSSFEDRVGRSEWLLIALVITLLVGSHWVKKHTALILFGVISKLSISFRL